MNPGSSFDALAALERENEALRMERDTLQWMVEDLRRAVAEARTGSGGVAALEAVNCLPNDVEAFLTHLDAMLPRIPSSDLVRAAGRMCPPEAAHA